MMRDSPFYRLFKRVGMPGDNPYTPPREQMRDDADVRPPAVVLWMSRFVLVTKWIFWIVLLANIGFWSFVLVKAILHASGAPPLLP